LPDNVFYHVTPALHEPGPIHMSGFQSASGIPVTQGERLKITASYDNQLPHVRVMGIFGVYFSPDPTVTSRCGPFAIDPRETNTAGRSDPPRFPVPLARHPRGPWKSMRTGATVRADDAGFSRERVRLRKGAKLRWRFNGSVLHNVTLASGPRGFSSPNLDRDRTFSHRFSVPGTYKIFCTLHPVQMVQVIRVREK
jgi:plastocyanin